ncbi:MAG: hypothetical protein ACK4YP_14365 [Myxococcota bacterium]
MPAEASIVKAERYTRLRWVGIALFCVAAPNLVAGIAAVAAGRAGFGLVPVCLLALGLSLGAFGTNDDAALHAFSELDRRSALPGRFRAEWDGERKRRPARSSGLHDHPKASLVMPLAALAALALALWRVATAWGVLS